MGRWRPPRQRGSKYITRAGAEALQAELRQLWKVERPKVTDAVHEAAKNGDRSENGDYIYGKRRLAEIDRRVRYLSKRLDELTIVDGVPARQDKVYFAAHVTVEDEDGAESTYQIVGPDEFDLRQNRISMDSPLARALLGKELDDEVEIETPTSRKAYFVTGIRYGG
ncbi:transcription elongation factor GreB [Gilvimarinus sp. DZF01]|uniref:transcription elongation factor GreB n=1 Tax=Gilvimarinus sp. DZF01 TaxID=3461371 RepID=UPI004045ADCC